VEQQHSIHAYSTLSYLSVVQPKHWG